MTTPHRHLPAAGVRTSSLNLLVTDTHGTVLAAWEMHARGPAGLVVQVADLISGGDVAALGRVRRDPAAYQVMPGEPAAYQRGYEQARHDVAADLLARIKRIEEPDGSWPGADVVDILTGWFTGLGLDVEAAVTQHDDAAARFAAEWASRTGGLVTVFTAAEPITRGQPITPCSGTEARPASAGEPVAGIALCDANPGEFVAAQSPLGR